MKSVCGCTISSDLAYASPHQINSVHTQTHACRDSRKHLHMFSEETEWKKKNLLPASKSWLEDSLRIRNLKIALYLVMSNISDSKLTTTQTHTSTRRPRVSCSSINLKPHEEVKSSHGHFHQRGTPNTHSYVVPMNHSHTSALPFISQTFC